MEHPLFETARKQDPQGSKNRADTINKHFLNSKMAPIVLECLKNNPLRTAAEIGEILSKDDIKRISWPHKLMKKLTEAGLVKRIERKEDKQFICVITDKGLEYLNGNI